MALAIAAVVVSAVITLALVVTVARRQVAHTDERVLSFHGQVKSVTCDLDAGNVAVVAIDAVDDTIVVRRSLRHARRAPTLVEAVDDGRLRIEARGAPGVRGGWWWVDYEVHVPAHVSVTARTAAGTVSVQGVHGDVDLATDAGRVRAHAVGGALRLRTRAGAIEGEELCSRRVDARTEAGHVRMSFVEPPDALDVDATAGAIELELPGGPYRVDAASTAGRARVTVPTDPDATRTVTARSSAGSVRVVATVDTTGDVELVEERLNDLTGTELVAALLAELYERYGEEDPEAPDAEELAPPDGMFVVARVGGRPLGCGGLRRYDQGVGEIKRMYVAPDARRTGLARQILDAVEARARAIGYQRLRLETGVRQPEAIALYEQAGYRRVPNYPPYDQAPLSVCYEKVLRER